MYLNALIPHITSPTQITPRSKTLIDNIFSTFPPEEVRGGNLISSVSDHLAQYFFLNNTEIETSKKKMYQRNIKNFNKEAFEIDLKNIQWNNALKLDKKDVDESFKSFLNIFEILLDTYAPVVSISNSEKKLKLKSWITKGILTSIKKKNIKTQKSQKG